MIEVSNLAYMWHVFLLSYVQCIIILDRVISQLDTNKSIVLGVWSWASSRVLFSQQKYNAFTWYHLQFVCSLFLWEGGQGSIAYRAVRQTRIYEYCKLLDILQSNIIRYWKQHERKKAKAALTLWTIRLTAVDILYIETQIDYPRLNFALHGIKWTELCDKFVSMVTRLLRKQMISVTAKLWK